MNMTIFVVVRSILELVRDDVTQIYMPPHTPPAHTHHFPGKPFSTFTVTAVKLCAVHVNEEKNQ